MQSNESGNMGKRKKYSALRINSWLLLNQVSESLMKYEDTEFRMVGITKNQFYILSAIKYLPPPVTPSDIARWLDRNTNTITLMVDRMERSGLVKKRRDLPDRRAFRMTLTPKSRILLRKALIPFREVPEEIMACLSDDELHSYMELTQKIREKVYDKLGLHEGTVKLHTHRIELMASVNQKRQSIRPKNSELLQSKNVS